MATSIVNAKVDCYTKEQVDEVLKRENRTASEVIQTLWDYLARQRELPDFMCEPNEASKLQRQMKKIEVLQNAVVKSEPSGESINRDYRELLDKEMMTRHG
jgi:antitoxin component of RelBE/YafQ-DinJ toxin-antitoxin module